MTMKIAISTIVNTAAPDGNPVPFIGIAAFAEELQIKKSGYL
jgi:hypothetical protein